MDTILECIDRGTENSTSERSANRRRGRRRRRSGRRRRRSRLARAGHSVVIVERSDYGRPRGRDAAADCQPRVARTRPLRHVRLVAADPLLRNGERVERRCGRSTLAHPQPAWPRVARRPGSFRRDVHGRRCRGGRHRPAQTTVRTVARDRRGGLSVLIEEPSARVVLRTTQVVDASGRSAQIARSLGAVSRRIDGLVAVSVVCDLPPGLAAGDTFVEAVADGWWYVSPLPGCRRIISFFTDSSIARSLGLTRPSAWWDALHRTDHVVHLARQAAPTSLPAVASAASRFLAPAAGDDWVAVGDARSRSTRCRHPASSTPSSGRGRRARSSRPPWRCAPQAPSYDAWISSAADQYLAQRAEYYTLADRYADSPFWQARRAVPPHTGPTAEPTWVST